MSKRIYGWVSIPVCLFLILFGMSIPNLACLDGVPKPHPRAICETESIKKATVPLTAAQLFAVELADNLPGLQPPLASRAHFPVIKYQFRSVTLARSGARAPPGPGC